MNKLTRADPFDDLFRGFFVRPVDMNLPATTPSIKMDVTEQPKAFLAQALAKFNDGVLELTLPKKAAGTSKRLTIL